MRLFVRLLQIAVVLVFVTIGFIALASVAHANPSSAPGAGDCADEEDNVPDPLGGSLETCNDGDVANMAAGQNPPLGADDSGGFLHNPSDALVNVVFPAIIEHHPLCDVHDTDGDH